MSRLYGPGHFTEDPYSQIVSPHGIPVDDLVSVLQKEIRRSRIDNAVLAAYEMFITSPDVAQHLWRRLRLIAVEDVGMGLPLGPVLIDVLHRTFNETPAPPRRSGQRDRTSPVPMGKRHRGSRRRLRCRRRLRSSSASGCLVVIVWAARRHRPTIDVPRNMTKLKTVSAPAM